MANKILTLINAEAINSSKNTAAEIHSHLFGEESCFLVKEDYHGLYEDDDCTFTYYSNETGEYFGDTWTTRFFCPDFSRYKTKYTFDEAVKLGLVNIEKFNENFIPTGIDFEYMKSNPYEFISFWERYPIVEVFRGHSFKGRKGYLLGTTKDYGRLAVIYDANDNQFFTVKKSYIQIAESFITNLTDAIHKAIDEEKKVTNRIQKFDTEDKRKVMDNVYFFGLWELFKHQMENKYSEWSIQFEAELEQKLYAPSEKLLQWVRNHFPQVTDEKEIYNIGFKINKKNAR